MSGLGIWEDATPIQRSEVQRMKKQVGLYEMALRLAIRDMKPGGDYASVTARMDSYLKAAVIVGAEAS